MTLIATIPIGPEDKPSRRYPETVVPVMAGDVPVEILRFGLRGMSRWATVFFRCRACGYQDYRRAGGDDKAIDKALSKIEASPYCRDCRACRAGRCRHADIGRCCVACGRESAETKQGVLPGLDTSIVIEADIAAARSDAAVWDAVVRDMAGVFALAGVSTP